MNNHRQRLIEENKRDIENKRQKIKKAEEELEMSKARIKVERKFMEMESIRDELKEEVKYILQASEDMLVQEEDRLAELKRSLEISENMLSVIDKSKDSEL